MSHNCLTASCMGLHSHGMLVSAKIASHATSTSFARLSAFASTFLNDASSSSLSVLPQNINASLSGISSKRTKRCPISANVFSAQASSAKNSGAAPAFSIHGRARCAHCCVESSRMYAPFIQSSFTSSKIASFFVMRDKSNALHNTSREISVVSPSSDHPSKAKKFTIASGR